jgi:hypothetical protein
MEPDRSMHCACDITPVAPGVSEVGSRKKRNQVLDTNRSRAYSLLAKLATAIVAQRRS